MKLFYNPPTIIKNIFPQTRWTTSNDKVLLTFDDGPIPETTPIILEVLDELKIKALFFCVGENLKKYNSLAGEIISRGHSIGNHTYNHANVMFKSRSFVERQVKLFDDEFVKLFGTETSYFRPPKGRIPIFTGKKALSGKKNVMWSLLTYDYKNDLNIVKFAVQNYLEANSIIVLHDSLKSRDIIKESIKFIAEEVRRRHYEFGEPEECLK